MMSDPDFIVIGAGSAGCAVAAGLVARQAGSVTVIEAGPSDNSPFVKMPFGLVWMMGRQKRDWCFQSTPQAGLGGRRIAIPRGRMVGGSGSINSMVWFRGRQDDFEAWNMPGWGWDVVKAAFEDVEAHLAPTQLSGAHPLTRALHSMFRQNGTDAPTPERESAGVFRFNLHNGRRWSAADAFLRPAGDAVRLITHQQVDRIAFERDAARIVMFADGSTLRAGKGIVLSAGSIGSPAILMRSGLGPSQDLGKLGIDVIADSPGIGQNLHDHPGVGLHFVGPNSGYGITAAQAAAWAIAPLQYLVSGSGRLASPTVEGGGFFNARGLPEAPDVQTHFIPFMLGWKGQKYTAGSGYFADVCLCRPKSRGQLRLTHKSANAAPEIDLGLFRAASDLDTMVAGVRRLRTLLDATEFGNHRAPEAFPGPAVSSDEGLRAHIVARAATAYHPVGTLRMGTDRTAPVTERLAVRGVSGLWVADASVMPSITSANTNAPSMMIGHRAGHMISEDAA